MHTSRILGAVLVLAALSAGDARVAVAKDTTAPDIANAARTQVSESFELSVDGKFLKMKVAQPSQLHFVRADLTANRVFSFAAGDRQANFMLVVAIGAPPGRALVPGVYESYNCDPDHACDDPPKPSEERLTASIMPHPDVVMQVGDLKEALKAPKLGLPPLIVTITKVEDANLKGVGPRKRLQGSFKGRLAYVSNDQHHVPHVVGRVTEVEGKFDLYVVMYKD
jgi:hypothetical protein